MAPASQLAPARPARLRSPLGARWLGPGIATVYLSVIVLLPLAAVVARSTDRGLGGFWRSVTSPQAIAALELTLVLSLGVVLVNAVAGTLIAWVLVRDDFRGKGAINSLIDLPFALPTIVAGLTLMALYGSRSPLGVNVAFTRAGLLLALLFVTLPFVVRAVQPVLLELDREMEQAAASLGAKGATIFRRVILPNLMPAIVSGTALGFARSLGEFGSVVLISGNIPFKTEVASVFIFGQVESNNVTAAAAVSVVLLLLSLVMIIGVTALSRWRAGHER